MERKIALGLGLVALVLLSLTIAIWAPWAPESSAAGCGYDPSRTAGSLLAADRPTGTAQTALASDPPTVTGEGVVSPAVPIAESSLDVFTREELLIDLYSQVSPSVVHIAVSTNAQGQGGTGTGFVLDGEGRIVTNNHVIEGADRIAVRFADGEIVEAKLLGADADSDLAVLQVDVPADQLDPVVAGRLGRTARRTDGDRHRQPLWL